MTQALMDKYPDTRDLTQEVVDIALNLIGVKTDLMAISNTLADDGDAQSSIVSVSAKANQLPKQLNKLIVSPAIKHVLHNIDFGEVRCDIAMGLHAINEASLIQGIAEQQISMEAANGHLSMAHKKLVAIAVDKNIRLPYSGFNGDGGGR